MIQRLPPEINSIYAYINPIIAVVLGSFVFGEPLTLYIAIGGGITLGGLYMVNQSIRKVRKIHVNTPADIAVELL
jgi:drug/metabolite transporter (DMT)-like permease